MAAAIPPQPRAAHRRAARTFATAVLLLLAWPRGVVAFAPGQALAPPFPVTSMLTSADGSTLALVGAAGQPSVALYMRSPSVWALQQVLQGVAGVALSGDGAALAAVPVAPATAPVVYARVGRVWSQAPQLPTPWGAGFSVSAVAFVNPGTLAALLGGPTSIVQLFAVGADGTWAAADSFAVASAGGGFTAGNVTVAAASYVPRNGQPAVALTTRDDSGAWAAPGAFVTSRDGGASDAFGAPQLSADGRALLAVFAGTRGCARPAVHVFRLGFGDWALEAAVVPVDGYAADPFASAAALASDGQSFVVGGTANATAAACGGGGYATSRVSAYRRAPDGTWAVAQRVLADSAAAAPAPCVAALALSGDSTALFIATTFANASAAPVLVYEAAAGVRGEPAPSSVADVPPPATLNEYVGEQQVYTPCCCTLAVSADGSTLVSGSTAAPWPPAPPTCVSTFSRVATSWVLDTVLPGVVAPALSEDGTLLAAVNVSNGVVVGVNVYSGPQWSQVAQLPQVPGIVLGVAFAGAARLAVAVWVPSAPPCPAGALTVRLFAPAGGGTWAPGATLLAPGCPANPGASSLAAVTASSAAVAVGAAATIPSGGAEGVVYAWALGGDGAWVARTLTGAGGGAGDAFGAVGTFATKGTLLAVGAPAGPTPPPGTCAVRGAAHLFSAITAAPPMQSWPQVAKLVPSDGAAGDLTGAAVALSADGSTAVVASSPAGASCAAQAYVFQRTGPAGWTQTQRLFPVASAAPCIVSVALTLDGAYAFVGTFNASATPRGLTPIVVFAGRPAPTQTQPPPPPPPPFPAFALAQSMYSPCCCSIAVAGDGLTFVSSGVAPQCAAVYTRPPPAAGGGNWTLEQVLPGIVGAVLSHDGAVLVGALNPAVPPYVPPTTVVVYARSGAVYQPTQQLPPVAQGATIIGLGYVDGSTFAVATWGVAPPNASCAGAPALNVQLLAITSGSWTLDANLTTSDCPSAPPAKPAGIVPWSVATGVGAVAVSLSKLLASGLQGATYVFTRGADAVWTQAIVTAADGGVGDTFGTTASFSRDAMPSLVVGAPGGPATRGAAYSYALGDVGLWAQAQRIAPSDGLTGDSFATAVAASAGGATLVAATATRGTGNCSAQAYVFAYDAGPGAWVQQQLIAASTCVSAVAVTPDGADVFVGVQDPSAPKPVGPINVYSSRAPSASATPTASTTAESTAARVHA